MFKESFFENFKKQIKQKKIKFNLKIIFLLILFGFLLFLFLFMVYNSNINKTIKTEITYFINAKLNNFIYKSSDSMGIALFSQNNSKVSDIADINIYTSCTSLFTKKIIIRKKKGANLEIDFVDLKNQQRVPLIVFKKIEAELIISPFSKISSLYKGLYTQDIKSININSNFEVIPDLSVFLINNSDFFIKSGIFNSKQEILDFIKKIDKNFTFNLKIKTLKNHKMALTIILKSNIISIQEKSFIQIFFEKNQFYFKPIKNSFFFSVKDKKNFKKLLYVKYLISYSLSNNKKLYNHKNFGIAEEGVLKFEDFTQIVSEEIKKALKSFDQHLNQKQKENSFFYNYYLFLNNEIFN